jgi:hypothetical protein
MPNKTLRSPVFIKNRRVHYSLLYRRKYYKNPFVSNPYFKQPLLFCVLRGCSHYTVENMRNPAKPDTPSNNACFDNITLSDEGWAQLKVLSKLRVLKLLFSVHYEYGPFEEIE